MPPETDPVPLKHRELERIALCALKAARILLESGARVKVVHEGAALVAKGLGADIIGMRAGYASLEITVSNGANTITRMTSVGPHGVDHRLDQAARDLCLTVSQGGMSVEAVEAAIDQLARKVPRYGAATVALAVGLACAAFGRLLGVDWAAFLPVFVAGTAGQYTRHLLRVRGINAYVIATVIAFLAAALAGLGAMLAGSASVPLAMIAAILLLVPGVPATNAQTDIMDGYPSMGSARAVAVLMVMIFATVGVWIAEVMLGVG